MQPGLNSLVKQQLMAAVSWIHQKKRGQTPFWKHLAHLLLGALNIENGETHHQI